MIVVGIMSIVRLVIASMISNMIDSQAALDEKLATIDAANGLQRALSDSGICGAQLSQPLPPVNLTAAGPSIVYPEIRMGLTNTSPLIVKTGQPLPGYPANKIVVQSITLKNIVLISGNSFSGDLEVAIDRTTMRRSLKSFGVKNLIFTVTPPLNAAVVAGCGSGSASVGPWILMANTSGVIYQAPGDGVVIITSGFNRGIRLSTGTVSTLLTEKGLVSSRDKYGQGFEYLSLPLAKDEFWRAESTDGGSNSSDPFSVVYFRTIN